MILRPVGYLEPVFVAGPPEVLLGRRVVARHEEFIAWIEFAEPSPNDQCWSGTDRVGYVDLFHERNQWNDWY